MSRRRPFAVLQAIVRFAVEGHKIIAAASISRADDGGAIVTARSHDDRWALIHVTKEQIDTLLDEQCTPERAASIIDAWCVELETYLTEQPVQMVHLFDGNRG